jgi:hypothetical protein
MAQIGKLKLSVRLSCFTGHFHISVERPKKPPEIKALFGCGNFSNNLTLDCRSDSMRLFLQSDQIIL